MFYYSNLVKNVASNVYHCPFNAAHTMPEKTLLLHLTKCPDKTSNLTMCSFNAQHFVETCKLIVSNLKKKNHIILGSKIIIYVFYIIIIIIGHRSEIDCLVVKMCKVGGGGSVI